ncbi:type IV secretion system protein VirB6 [Phyllobacterium myrsinacearum]|uniref:type IV secretion system protein n=1 Tax=Phyllobacterium myrsinacearum TaxID=28101 RepID=UPI0010292696|nr:type IV secretion system protein [Phyllobacterium myrsinacearum]RZS70621.1 type IV secretion system protein VirB6 [Phyllobacterium myrsinacearum]
MNLLVTFYGDAMRFFDKVNGESIGRAWSVLAENRSLVSLLFTLFVILYCLSVALGYSRGSLQDAAVTGLKVVIAYAFIMSWPDFNALAGQILLHGPEQIGAALAAKMGGVAVGTEGMADLVRNVAVRSYNFASAVMRANDSWVSLNIVGLLAMSIVLVGLIPLLLILTGVTLFGKFIIAIMLAIGPFAIMAYFFKQARFLFEAWLKGLAFGFCMLLFTFIILGLSFSFLDQIMAAIGTTDFDNTGVVAKVVALACYLLLICYFVCKVPDFAQTFAFGTGLAFQGMGGGGARHVAMGTLATALILKGEAFAAARSASGSRGAFGPRPGISLFSRQLTARLRGRNR